MANLKIKLTRSAIGYSVTQKRTAKALGLTKMGRTVVRPDNEQIRGMCHSISHLVTVTPADEPLAS